MIREFFEEIKYLTYCVQRNWDNLPDTLEYDGHDDLDILVASGNVDAFKKILSNYPEIERVTDVRTEIDGYYPIGIANRMLFDRELVKGLFWVPNNKSHFESLYYHGELHKEENPYRDKLRELFFNMCPPTKCNDEGVGYYLKNYKLYERI